MQGDQKAATLQPKSIGRNPEQKVNKQEPRNKEQEVILLRLNRETDILSSNFLGIEKTTVFIQAASPI